jgi:hypothetical protein
MINFVASAAVVSIGFGDGALRLCELRIFRNERYDD